MNEELIQKLAEEAGFSVYNRFNGKEVCVTSPYQEDAPLNEEIDYFVELIVKECIEILDNEPSGLLRPYHRRIREVLEEHFGVE
jgi:hypothetical protein